MITIGTYYNLIEMLKGQKKNGIKFVYANEEEYMSYAELYSESRRVLGGLQKIGIKPGNELVFQINNNKVFMLVFWACLIGKIIPVPVSIGNGREENIKVFEIWSQMNNPYLIYSDNSIEKFKRFLKENKEYENVFDEIEQKSICWSQIDQSESGTVQEIGQDDIAYIQFSSGSTSAPKGVVLTHKNLMENIKAILKGAEGTQDDVLVTWMPLTHDMGLIGMHFSPMAAGMKQINLNPMLFIQKPYLWLEVISENKATIISSPNFGFRYISERIENDSEEHNWNMESVRIIFNGAEPISYDICNKFIQDFKKFGLKENSMFPVYGMAEASLAVSFPKLQETMIPIRVDRRFLSIGDKVRVADNKINEAVFVDLGYAVDSCQFKVADDDEKELDENRVGNVLITGSSVTSAYYNQKDLSNILFNDEGWLRTGDIGFVNKGRMVIIGRKKDMIIVNGLNYYCVDLERIILPLIEKEKMEVSVCGAEEGDAEIIVFLKYRKKYSELVNIIYHIKKTIHSEVKLRVAHVIPVKNFPKTTSGKVQRYKLYSNYQKGIYRDIIDEIAEEIRKQNQSIEKLEAVDEVELTIKQIIEEVIRISPLGVTEDLYQYGISSVQVGLIFDRIQKYYEGQVEIADLFILNTIRSLADLIKSSAQEIKYVSMPSGILNNEKARYQYEELNICFDEEITRKLDEFAQKKEMSVNKVLCVMYLYNLWEYSGNGTVNTYVVFKPDQICNIELNMETIEDVTMLFNIAKNYEFGTVNYKVFEQKGMIDEDNAFLSIMCDHEVINDKLLNVLNCFTAVIKLKSSSGGIEVFYQYNCNKMNMDTAKHFVKKYLHAIKLILDIHND